LSEFEAPPVSAARPAAVSAARAALAALMPFLAFFYCNLPLCPNGFGFLWRSITFHSNRT